MFQNTTRWVARVALVVISVAISGCSSTGGCGTGCGSGWGGLGGWGGGWSGAHLFHWRSNAIPERLPLGSVNRAHWHTQEANGEAADFIFHRNDFVGNTAELTPDAKDRILEVGARMRSAPFPVLVEREKNNSDPELDAARRDIVAAVLYDLGNPDADQRTIVAPAYGHGLNSTEAASDYYRFIYSRGGFGTAGAGNTGFGGAGGGVGAGGF